MEQLIPELSGLNKEPDFFGYCLVVPNPDMEFSFGIDRMWMDANQSEYSIPLPELSVPSSFVDPLEIPFSFNDSLILHNLHWPEGLEDFTSSQVSGTMTLHFALPDTLNLRSETENRPKAHEIAQKLRPEPENLPKAHEIANNLRPEAENLPEAHEIAKNLRSEAESLPKAQEIAQNLRPEAENLPEAHEIAQNLRPEAKACPKRTKSPKICARRGVSADAVILGPSKAVEKDRAGMQLFSAGARRALGSSSPQPPAGK